MPSDLKEHTPNEFYDISIKLDKHKSPTQRDFMLHCVKNKHMSICITSACAMLKKGNENVPHVANKVFKKLDYNVSMTTPDEEINALLDEEKTTYRVALKVDTTKK